MKILPSRFVRCVLLAAACTLASGCYSKATGYHGKFTFAYATGLTEVENFVKPIAPGAKLALVAFANGTENELVVTRAVSSRPGVVAVESVKDHTVVLKGVEPGVADIELTARDKAGNILVDKMFVHVAKPAVHPLEHSCTDSKDAVYVSGETVNIFHALATSDGRAVIGYGYAPVRVEPARALELVSQPQDAPVYMFKARAKEQKVTVKSTVDGNMLSLRIVDRGELKDATLRCAGGCRIIAGQSQYVAANVTMGDVPVCSQNALTKARSLTPEVCSVTANLDEEEGVDSNNHQLAVVKGLKFGVCKFEVTLPELDSGKGVRLSGSAQIGRLEFPNERGEGGRNDAWPLQPKNVSAWTLATAWWLAPKLFALVVVAWGRRRRLKASA